ncbi:MAG: FIST C-terminal domain-containing protein [Deltaproteobacteria bacterium]|nr:FIST C-terminal domain-containing protein [Deltaproteobacteria bacterium]
MDGIVRNVTVAGLDADVCVRELADRLAGAELRLVIVFADWRIDPYGLAKGLQKALGAPVVGCSAVGVVAGSAGTVAAVGYYGDWLRVGIGVAADLPKSPLARSRDAMERAAEMLGLKASALDPQRHVALGFVDGNCGHEEAFCIGSAAAAPQIRIAGGSASNDHTSSRRSFVWANGEALADAGVVVVLESELPFESVTSCHLVPTEGKTVVTAASGRLIEELDGMPAVKRLHQLIEKLGGTLDTAQPSEYAFARFVGGKPYVRSMHAIDDHQILLASSVEPGHVLHVMRPGDLIAQTQRDLALAAERVGGVASMLVFSCVARHWEAQAKGLERALAATYAVYPTIGFQSFGEQTGTLLVNHTLTGLAIGHG